MNINNSVYLRKLDQMVHNFSVLGSMKENERLFILGNRFYKNRAPDRVLKKEKNPILRVINKIVTLAIKILQAIGRVLTGQKVEQNIQKATKLSEHLEAIFNQDGSKGYAGCCSGMSQKFPQAENSRDYYKALQKLHKLHESLDSAHKVGLPVYKKTCEVGNASLQKDAEEVLKRRGEAVEGLIDKVQDISASLKKQIEDAEKMTMETDREKTTDLLGKFVGKEDVSAAELEEMYFFLDAAKETLINKFGRTAVERALKYYKLSGSYAISGRDYYALLVGIVVNFTYDDLKTIYEKDSDNNEFENLNDKELCEFLQGVRDIDEDLFSADGLTKYQQQFTQDLELLKRFGEVGEFNIAQKGENLPVEDLKKLSYTEYLSRVIAYGIFHQGSAKFPDGMLLPMYDKKGELQLKEAHTLVSEKGVHGAIIKPVIIGLEQQKAKAQVIFRGTHCKHSLARDISPFEAVNTFGFDGPGRCSFEEKGDQIVDRTFDHIEEMVKRSKGLKVGVEFIGHSLGGSDAQRALEYFVYQLKAKENHCVDGVNLYVFNSPNVESDIAARFIESVDQLTIPVRLRYFDVHHDPIQEFGAKRLGYCSADVKKPGNLKISIFKFDRKLSERVQALAKFFFKRSRWKLLKAFEAHSFHCLKLHDNENEEALNITFVEDLFTDFEGNKRYLYGENREKESKILGKELLNDYLVTRTCRVGRRMKRLSYKVYNMLNLHRLHPRFQSVAELP